MFAVNPQFTPHAQEKFIQARTKTISHTDLME